jgi:hypothetical protein
MTDNKLAALEATLTKASQALRVFPLMHNGLVDDLTRETTRYKMALRAYSEAKAAVLAYNQSIKQGA